MFAHACGTTVRVLHHGALIPSFCHILIVEVDSHENDHYYNVIFVPIIGAIHLN